MLRAEVKVALLLPAVLLLVGLLFTPGLAGPWFFDDMAHVPKLQGTDGMVDTWSELLTLTLPTHGGSGRSFAYLTLLIDDNGWPTDPAKFKQTNLLLHLLNAVLVFAFVRLLLRTVGARFAGERADWAALIAMALWAVNPMQLSPVMMVIQRMTLLGALFSLLALLAYVQGRRVAPTRPRLGFGLLTVGFGSALLLGLLSKEIAIITVLYVLVIETTLFSETNPPRPRYWPAWFLIFIALPILATIGYVASVWHPTMTEAYTARDFTPSERVLTQARILIEYLQGILVPRLSHYGPFHDDYVPSRGLWEPASTAVSLLILVVLVGLALLRRRAWPLFSFAVLWFVLGHALESSVLCLELYFEHRNYLPMLGIYIAIGGFLVTRQGQARRAIGFAVGALFGLLALLALLTAQVWGSHERLAAIWSAEHPRSTRANIMAFQYYSEQRNLGALIQQLEYARDAAPERLGYRLYLVIAERCMSAVIPDDDRLLSELKQAIPAARFNATAVELLIWLTNDEGRSICRLAPEQMIAIVDLMLANPRFTGVAINRANFLVAKARVLRAQGDFGALQDTLDQVFEVWPNYEVPLEQAWDHATAGLFEYVDEYLARAKSAPNLSHAQALLRDQKIAQMREAIEELRTAAGTPVTTGNASEVE
jgi:protein O-mannosyl-transferase